VVGVAAQITAAHLEPGWALFGGVVLGIGANYVPLAVYAGRPRSRQALAAELAASI
jgi:hypothetical protein